jgi:phage terminase Nu1 subunit (DNA packaging protein)
MGDAVTAIPRWRRVTREQIALLLDIHPDTVSEYVRRGMPMLERGGRAP